MFLINLSIEKNFCSWCLQCLEQFVYVANRCIDDTTFDYFIAVKFITELSYLSKELNISVSNDILPNLSTKKKKLDTMLDWQENFVYTCSLLWIYLNGKYIYILKKVTQMCALSPSVIFVASKITNPSLVYL